MTSPPLAPPSPPRRLQPLLTLLVTGTGFAGCVAPTPAATAPVATSAPIVLGTETEPAQFPSVVGLVLDAWQPDLGGGTFPLECVQGTGVCTGTLIREDVILTAAHCVANLFADSPLASCPDPEPPSYSFEVQLLSAHDGARTVATEKVVVHPSFAPSTACTEPPDVGQWNDVALVFLRESVRDAHPQVLADAATAELLLLEGSQVTVVGYGETAIDAQESGGTQRFGIATLDSVGPNELAVGNLGEPQACHGDSGGPVFANGVQVGIASRLRTPHCPSLQDLMNPPPCATGAFYTRVDAYADWITATIAAERPEGPPPIGDPPPPPPETTPDESPETTPDASPDLAVEATPEPTPEPLSEVGPETTAEPSPTTTAAAEPETVVTSDAAAEPSPDTSGVRAGADAGCGSASSGPWIGLLVVMAMLGRHRRRGLAEVP